MKKMHEGKKYYGREWGGKFKIWWVGWLENVVEEEQTNNGENIEIQAKGIRCDGGGKGEYL